MESVKLMKSWFAPEQFRCEHGRGGHEHEQRQLNAVLLLQRHFRLYHGHGSEQYDNEAHDHDERDTQVRLTRQPYHGGLGHCRTRTAWPGA